MHLPLAQGHGAQGHGAQGHGAQGHDAQGHGAQGHGAQGHILPVYHMNNVEFISTGVSLPVVNPSTHSQTYPSFLTTYQ